MEEQLAVASTMVSEMYYYLSIPLMVLIHAGFLAYEMGASRMKNVLASGVKNILAFAFMVPCLLYTSPSPRDGLLSRMPSSA